MNKVLVKEIEVLEILIDKIDFKEIEIKLPYQQPLSSCVILEIKF
jgi:hypothetical protein